MCGDNLGLQTVNSGLYGRSTDMRGIVITSLDVTIDQVHCVSEPDIVLHGVNNYLTLDRSRNALRFMMWFSSDLSTVTDVFLIIKVAGPHVFQNFTDDSMGAPLHAQRVNHIARGPILIYPTIHWDLACQECRDTPNKWSSGVNAIVFTKLHCLERHGFM